MSWVNQDKVYIVMYRSPKSGGTYSEIRRTELGLQRLLATLEFLGYKESDIIITEQTKAWMPDKRKHGKRTKREGLVVNVENTQSVQH